MLLALAVPAEAGPPEVQPVGSVEPAVAEPDVRNSVRGEAGLRDARHVDSLAHAVVELGVRHSIAGPDEALLDPRMFDWVAGREAPGEEPRRAVSLRSAAQDGPAMLVVLRDSVMVNQVAVSPLLAALEPKARRIALANCVGLERVHDTV